MAHVFVLATEGCPFCSKAKELLEDLRVSYFALDVSANEGSMEALGNGARTVPQIFLNGRQIGGFDKLKELHDRGSLLAALREPPPAEALLPAHPSATLVLADDATAGGSPGHPGAADAVPDEGAEESKGGCGVDASSAPAPPPSSWLSVLFRSPVRSPYGYNPLRSPPPLNALDGKMLPQRRARPQPEASPDAGDALRELFGAIGALLGSVVDGQWVRLRGVQTGEVLARYLSSLDRLRSLDARALPPSARKALFLNLYNALLVHAQLVYGVPKSMYQRLRLYSCASYIVGGLVLSLNDIEHGVLRANARAPLALSRPFSSSDRRRALAMPSMDPRIHFALNCGALSCPPVKVYSPEGVEQELSLATKAFLDADSSLQIDDSGQVSRAWHTGCPRTPNIRAPPTPLLPQPGLPLQALSVVSR